MKVEIGTKGLSNSWQADFDEEAKCKCGRMARIAFVAQEQHGEKKYISDLHKNKKGSFWPHDAIAIAVYFCKNCFEVVVVWNQA